MTRGTRTSGSSPFRPWSSTRRLAAVLATAAHAVACGDGGRAGELGMYAPYASGSGGAPAAGGAAGAPPEAGGGAPEYDPNVHFYWPESTAQMGECVAGVYTGNFICSQNLFFLVSGPVRFTLTEGVSGEFLEITDGTLEGSSTGITFSGGLSGQLDCSLNHLHGEVGSGIFGPPPVTGTFSGSLEGTLDRSTQTLSGVWSFAPTFFTGAGSAAGPPCQGVWSASRQR